MNSEERKQHELLINKESMQKEFDGYYYNENDNMENEKTNIILDKPA